jgi:hypothetical protein
MRIFPRTPRALRKWRGVDERVALAARALLDQTLAPMGWDKSVISGKSQDQHGPVPWYTYAARLALESCVAPGARVFEFGSGGSTLWWLSRACAVTSVEHDPTWHAAFASEVPAGVSIDIRLRPASTQGPDQAAQLRAGSLADRLKHPSIADDAQYLAYAAEAFRAAGPFDVIVIDGVARNLCSLVALECLAPDGLIVFDNAERAQYQPGHDALANAGLVRVDFWGPGPINPYPWTTALYTRSLAALRHKPQAPAPAPNRV